METIGKTGMMIEEIEFFIKRFVFNTEDLNSEVRWYSKIDGDSINIRPKNGNTLHCLEEINKVVCVLKLHYYVSSDIEGIYIHIF